MDKDIAGSLLHKAFRVDEPALAALPTGKDKAERKERAKLFQQADGNGNGILSLAEADNLVKRLLNVDGMGDLRPVINRSFHAARDIVPPVGNFSPHYIDRYEFRFFLLYLQHYLELWKLFAALQIGPEGLKSDSGRKLDGRFDHDKRLSFAEFQKGLPMLLAWPKLHPATKKRLETDPAKVWREEMDDNEGGLVLFDEFAHWILYCEIFTHDEDDDDAELEEALEVLKKQKPNLCGKGLDSIKAAKAKYRVDAPIHGQGCLTRDHNGRLTDFAGGLAGDKDAEDKWLRKGQAAKELVKGGHYAGSLNDWEAKQRKHAWKSSLKRTDDEVKKYKKHSGLCENGCGRPVFGHFPTCCTHCTGKNGPHAFDCGSKGRQKCVNGCGRLQFGRFDTCCTKCTGKDGPHAHDCLAKNQLVCQPVGKPADKRAAHKPKKPSLARTLTKGLANVSKRFSLKNMFGKGDAKVAPDAPVPMGIPVSSSGP